jgi:hypothetical protein
MHEETRRTEKIVAELNRRSEELQRIATEKTIELTNSLIIGGSNDIGRGVHTLRSGRDLESSKGDLPYNINPAVSKKTVIEGFKEKGYVNFIGEQITGHPDIADHWRTTAQILRIAEKYPTVNK